MCSGNVLAAKNTAKATAATQQSFVEAEEQMGQVPQMLSAVKRLNLAHKSQMEELAKRTPVVYTFCSYISFSTYLHSHYSLLTYTCSTIVH